MSRYLAQIPDQPDPAEHLQRVISNVNFPPEKALARRRHMVVVIVVPAFAQSHQREQPVVAAGGARFIAPAAEQVRERIDGKRVVPQQYSAQAEAPDKERPSADQSQHRSQSDGRYEMI